MRKGLLFAVALICALVAQADPVDREAALRKAQTFMQGKGLSISSAAAPAARAPRKSPQQKDASSYYIFNADAGRGFVIVSGDDRTVPILGYSLSGSFNPDNIPDNMRAWLQGYADYIEALGQQDLEDAAPQQDDAGEPQQKMTTESIEPLLTTTWNQSAPYSDNCPVLPSGEQCATGCVATAVAQVMNYHRWPAATTADIPAYTTSSYSFSIDGIPAGAAIDWDNMKSDYSWWNPYTEEQGKAVADLMQYCGAAFSMDYGPESSASAAIIAPALKKYFDYDPNMYTAVRSDYTIDKWNSLMFQELMNKRPVVYCGQSTGGGHCFVIDGYDGSGLFHVNWGWGGYYDGYFAISVLNPESNDGIGASSSSDGYSMSQSAVIGMQPNGAENPMPPTGSNNMLTAANLCVVGDYVVCDFWNYTENSGTFYFGFFTVDSEERMQLQRYWSVSLPIGYGYPNMGIYIPDLNLAKGTYKMYPIGVYGDPSSLINGTISYNHDNYVLITVGDNGEVTLERHPVVALEVTSVKMPENPTAFAQQTITATIKNNGDEFNGTFYVYAKAESETKKTHIMSTGAAIPSGGSTDIDIYFTPALAENYTIQIYTDEHDANLVGEFVLEVAEAEIEKLEITDLMAYNEAVVGRDFNLTATIANYGADYDGTLHVFTASEAELNEGYCRAAGAFNAMIPSGGDFTVDFTIVPQDEGTNWLWISSSADPNDYITNLFSFEAAGLNLEVTNVVLPEHPTVGEEQVITVTITNNGSDYNGSLFVAMCAESDTDLSEIKYNDVSIPAGKSTELEIRFTPTKWEDYYFWIASDQDYENIFGMFTMNVPQPSDLLGDVDGDGRLTVADVVLLSRFISDSDPSGVVTANADVTCDGRVNVIDVVELARLISNQ